MGGPTVGRDNERGAEVRVREREGTSNLTTGVSCIERLEVASTRGFDSPAEST